MFKRSKFLVFIGMAALAAVLTIIAAGCGSGGAASTATVAVSPECEAAPTIIPPTTGKPMLVEFFRDT